MVGKAFCFLQVMIMNGASVSSFEMELIAFLAIFGLNIEITSFFLLLHNDSNKSFKRCAINCDEYSN